VATDSAGVEFWHGPFEPFGRDPWAGTNLAASAEDVFLRFPGQWDDEAWLEATPGGGGVLQRAPLVPATDREVHEA
jgi:hypothetical protein